MNFDFANDDDENYIVVSGDDGFYEQINDDVEDG